MPATDPKERARELIERLAPNQVAAVVGLIEFMLDPVSRAIAQAPLDDEPETEEEHQAVAEAKEWFQHHPGIPFEQVLSDSGLTLHDLESSKESK